MNPSEERYLNRELSWLEFNSRVLGEAMSPSNLLLDRLKFLGIVSSNLDEFFMVRVAALEPNPKLAKEVRAKAYQLIESQNQYFSKIMIPELEAAQMVQVPIQNLAESQFAFIKSFFFKELFPVLTPIAVFEDKPAPLLMNLSIYILVALVLSSKPGERKYALVEVPKNFPRMISLPSEKGYQFVLLENLISCFAKELFLGYEIVSKGLIRLTRAAEMTFNEESDEDFAQVMAEALKKRRQNNVVRAEAVAEDAQALAFLKKKLEMEDEQIYSIGASWLDLKGVSQLAYQPLFPELKRPLWQPRPAPKFEDPKDLWETIKQGDIWLHHPYESFEAVERFIALAASDPDVLAIKQTLYRVGQDSEIAHLLERAAENGKHVTVLVELKARFDEEKNISWARRLENAGASVIYGVAGFKTHAKACLVVRREPEGIKRYLHFSTGNYNEKTAQIYSDIGYFTANEELAHDLTIFFNMITGFSQPMSLSKLVVAPYGLRQRLQRLIKRETLRSIKEKPGLIMAKMNSLVDPEIIESLYEASRAGVVVKLNVRGICCLKPGVKGFSENIEVVSIVDMFLEHSRVFYFLNGGEDEIYLSSADWMPRNLNQRIELMVPIEHPKNKKELKELLKLYFKDNVKSWRLLQSGSYERLAGTSQEKAFRVQEYLCQQAMQLTEQKRKVLPQELKPKKPQ